jgi:formylglycine-generating enzyme
MFDTDSARRMPDFTEAAASGLQDAGRDFRKSIVRGTEQNRRPMFTAGRVLVMGSLALFTLLYFSWQQRSDGSAGPAPGGAAIARASTDASRGAAATPALNIDTPSGLMVLIPAGELRMGSDSGRKSARYGYENEAPAHVLVVAAFYMDVTEVSNGMYVQFCRQTVRSCPANPPWDSRYRDRAHYPVMNVSWNDANDFCQWAGKELPSEAQWERAARGDEQTVFPWGNDEPRGRANLKGDDDYLYAAPVGSFPADRSAFGVLDTAGNVPEWTADDYSLYPGNPARLPEQEKNHKVIRGGGFMTDQELARLTNRASAPPVIRPGAVLQVGFRCVATVDAVLKRSSAEPH